MIVSWHIFNFALLNSRSYTAPIFTKISHDVDALVQKTMLHFV